MSSRWALRGIAIVTFAALGVISHLPLAKDLGIDPVFDGPWWRVGLEGLFVAILFGSALWGNRGAWLVVTTLASLAALWSLGQATEGAREANRWIVAAEYLVLALALWGLKPERSVGVAIRAPLEPAMSEATPPPGNP
jgi:hypothetical protein